MIRTQDDVRKLLDTDATSSVPLRAQRTSGRSDMSRLHGAFLVPAGLLGCLTMSVAIVVGHVEVSQLQPHVGRTALVVEIAESPFQVIAGVRVPDQVPSRESVPSPSAAAAPAGLTVPTAAPPPEDLLAPNTIPDEVPQSSTVRRTTERTINTLPEPAQEPSRGLIYGALGVVRQVLAPLELSQRYDEVQQTVNPHYERAVAPTRPTRYEAQDEAAELVQSARS